VLPVLFNVVLPAAWAPLILAALAVALGVWQARAVKLAGDPTPSVVQTFVVWSVGAYAAFFFLVRALGDGNERNLFKLTRPLVVPLHTYGLLIATAFLVAIWLAGRTAERAGLDKDKVTDLSFWLLLSGMVGSRILFIIVNWDDYAKDPLSVLAFWKGGLVFYGGFIGATVLAFFYMRRHKMEFLAYADALVPSVSIGHAIGRLGCFAAGCCWGGACDPHFALAARFPPDSLAYQSQLGHGLIHAGALFSIPIHPTQLYESFGELLIFTTLTFWRSRKRFNGEILALYLMLYAPLRSIVETLRGDEERGRVFNFLGTWARGAWWNLSTSELISLGIFGAGVTLFALQSRAARRDDLPVAA
jgi:phosphatidylglycerol---prolipoprotein diacylglyceryl transferase